MERVGSRIIVAVLLAVISSLSFWSPVASMDFPAPVADIIGLLINFSVPCDLPSAISIPDQRGLLWPNILAVGYQEYRYDGASWTLVDQQAVLYNQSLARIGSLFANSPFMADAGTITFKLLPSGTNPRATVTAAPLVSVLQPFSIPILQLLNTTGSVNTSTYQASDYVQRFGTLKGLPPSSSTPSRSAKPSSPALLHSTLTFSRNIYPPSSPRESPGVGTSASMDFNTDLVTLKLLDFQRARLS